MSRKRTILVVVGLVVLLSLGFSYTVYQRSAGVLPRLRNAADQFDPPAGFVLHSRTEYEGSIAFCLITCYEPEIELMYGIRGVIDDKDLCNRVLGTLGSEVVNATTVLPTERAGCLVADLPEVSSTAFIQVIPGGCGVPGYESCVEVWLSNGR